MDKRDWALTDHICAECIGRVLEHTTEDGRVIARCADCGQEAEGGHRALCACGLVLRTGKAAGFYCARNGNHEPGMNPEIVGLFDENVCGVVDGYTR